MIGGGYANQVTAIFGTVGGGEINVAGGPESTVGGGDYNLAMGFGSTIAGGQENGADGTYSFVGGGYLNFANGYGSVVAGGGGYGALGFNNHANGNWSAIVGGYHQVADGTNSFIGGGALNLASGGDSTIPGGRNNTAAGQGSFAAGTRAKALHPSTFVWNDTLDSDFSSTASGQFLVHAKGGVGVNVTNPVPEGLSISSIGTALELRRGSIRVTGAGEGTTGPAFIHRAQSTGPAPNITDNYTVINHPLCNGDPNAILIITPNYNPGGAGGTYNNHPIGVFYVAGKWAVFNQDLKPMDDQSAFNVLVIKP